MGTAIDTSVLILAQRGGDLEAYLNEEGEPYYVPALAAAEYLLGVHLVKSKRIQQQAQAFYLLNIKPIVSAFDETDAEQLALLNFDLKESGQTLQLYDASIAATALGRGDALMTADGDFDRVKGLRVKKVSPARSPRSPG
ncbi:MAG: PIN domain-containing protein [Verrucomicrobiae bacterium]|nr:PIN domain-containing protein [Verrucomicrobiae bacterium]